MFGTRWIGLLLLSLALVGISGCGIVRHALHHHHHHPKRHKHVTIVIEKHHHHGGHHHDHCDD